MELIRGISGIRGIVGKTLTEEVVIKHIQAFSKIQATGDILLLGIVELMAHHLFILQQKHLADVEEMLLIIASFLHPQLNF